jgi:hypothetical protein
MGMSSSKNTNNNIEFGNDHQRDIVDSPTSDMQLASPINSTPWKNIPDIRASMRSSQPMPDPRELEKRFAKILVSTSISIIFLFLNC